MQAEAELTIDRPAAEVFDFIARGERLPDHVTEFAWVRQVTPGEPARGTEYHYKMARGQAEGTFTWSEFEPRVRLRWEGPPAKAGPGTMAPGGWWELTEAGGGTRAKLVMAPIRGGLFRMLGPLLGPGMRRGNVRALQRLKQQLER